jgi:hypothetical protein
MKKLILITAFISILHSTDVFGQKTKGIDTKIFGGPELTYMLAGDNSNSRGVGIGFIGGAQFDINFNKPIFIVLGVNASVVNLNRWLVNSTTASLKKYDLINSIEFPVGLGFNLSTKKYKKIYVNMTLVNNINLYSSHQGYSKIVGLEVQDRPNENYVGLYTPGAKGELGHNFDLGNNRYCSVGFFAKYMMWNFNKTNSEQYQTLSSGITIGVKI